MIQEDYVSFETAKLLKEKGFDESVNRFYEIYAGTPYSSLRSEYPLVKTEYCRNSFTTNYAAPTLQMAMKWLREVHDLHIIAYPFKSGDDTSIKHYCCQVFKTFNLLGYEKYVNETLTSYEEAVEAALKYCLEKLI